MDTVVIKTKESTLSELPYIDEQRFYFRTRGQIGTLCIYFTISRANADNQSVVSIKGGEFVDTWDGNSLGNTKTFGIGGHFVFVRILEDGYISFRNCEVVSAFGNVSSLDGSDDFCTQRNIDGYSMPYLEVDLADLSTNLAGLMTAGAAANNTTGKPTVVIKGDINSLAGFPSLVNLGIGTAINNGTLELSNIWGTLIDKISAECIRFYAFPTMIASSLINEKVTIDISAFSQCTKMTELKIFGVNAIGDLSILKDLKSLTTLQIDTPKNNVVGSFADLKDFTKIQYFRYVGQRNLEGGLNDLPASIQLIVASYQSSMRSYTTRAWNATMQGVLMPNCQFTTNEIDQLLIDLSKVTTWTGSKWIQLKGTPSSTGLEAITLLQNKGVTVTLS